MRIVSATFEKVMKNKEKKEILLKVSNGMKKFNVTISKEDLSYNDIKKHDVEFKAVYFERNCCSIFPMVILENDVNEESDKEVGEAIDKLIELVGDDIEKSLA